MQKYLNELSDTFDEKQCFEMAIMRICYISLIPTPFEVLIKKEENQNKLSDERNISLSTKENENEISTENGSNLLNTNLALNKYIPAPDKKNKNNEETELKKFSKLVDFLEEKSEMLIAYHLKNSFRLVSFSELKEKIYLSY